MRTINTNTTTSRNQPVFKNIRIATINVRTLQDDIKLATCIQTAAEYGMDIISMQEVRGTGTGLTTFDDSSLKGWQFVWGGHKRKKEHGVGILLAPHIQIQSYDIHLQARILSVRAIVRGVRIAILNVYMHQLTLINLMQPNRLFMLRLVKQKQSLWANQNTSSLF